MELPQPRAVGTEAGRKATHDFLSLYSSSPLQQDPSPTQVGYPKTRDFLQPLERGPEKNVTKEENKVEMIMTVHNRAPPTPPPPPAPPTPSVEHVLPGGIGTYSISYFNQSVLNAEGSSLFTAQASSNEEHSNGGSSYTGSGFTLWDDAAAAKKGKTGKEKKNGVPETHVMKESGPNVVVGQWPSQTTSHDKHNNTTFSSFSSSQNNQSFMHMITSANNVSEEYDDGDDEDFVIKKEPSSHTKGNLPLKSEAKTIDQKPNTPRSKHSATEQRRRSKINDRIQNLREIIPNSDQKRDRASFLLEVIEYIQFLQERVNKYESSYNTWNQEPSKMMQWRNSHIAEGSTNPSQGTNKVSDPASVFAAKFDEKKSRMSPTIPILVESNAPPIQPNIRTNIATKSCTSPGDKLKDQELAIESGTISVSSVYSKGLLNTLTQALHSSGVDLSHASISVQIDLAKKENGANSSASIVKDDEPRVASTGEDFNRAIKRLKTS